MGIKDLTEERAGVGIPIDDLLEGLDGDKRATLLAALRQRNPLRKREFLWSARAIQKACDEDGFEVSLWSISNWRRTHGH